MKEHTASSLQQHTGVCDNTNCLFPCYTVHPASYRIESQAGNHLTRSVTSIHSSYFLLCKSQVKSPPTETTICCIIDICTNTILDRHISSTVSQHKEMHGVYRYVELTEVRCGTNPLSSCRQSFSKRKAVIKTNGMVSIREILRRCRYYYRRMKEHKLAQIMKLFQGPRLLLNQRIRKHLFSTLSKQMKVFKVYLQNTNFNKPQFMSLYEKVTDDLQL